MSKLRYELPAVQHVSVTEFRAQTRAGDIFLVVTATPKLRRIITWGQQLMLRRFGYDKATAKQLSRYVHAGIVTNVQLLTGFEALPPSIGNTDIVADYGDGEITLLRATPDLELAELQAIRYDIPDWYGAMYDRLQYAVYPFYMAYGWVPGWWNKRWNDPNKPVCSGLCIRLLQAAKRLTHIKAYEMYPPARMPLIKGLRCVGRYRIHPTYLGKVARPRPWWLG